MSGIVTRDAKTPFLPSPAVRVIVVVDVRFKAPVVLIPTDAAPLRIIWFMSGRATWRFYYSESRHNDGTLCTRSGKIYQRVQPFFLIFYSRITRLEEDRVGAEIGNCDTVDNTWLSCRQTTRNFN
jgi:hypothetical protein